MHAKIMVYGPMTKNELDDVLFKYNTSYGVLRASTLETLDEALDVDNPRPDLPVVIVTWDYLDNEGWGDLMACRLIVEENDETYSVYDRHTPHIEFKEPVFDDPSPTFDPLVLKEVNPLLPNVYTAGLGDIDWVGMIANELAELEEAVNTGLMSPEYAYILAEIRAYCGYAVVLPGDSDYEQIPTFTNLIIPDAEQQRLQDVVARIKALPSDTLVHLVDMNV